MEENKESDQDFLENEKNIKFSDTNNIIINPIVFPPPLLQETQQVIQEINPEIIENPIKPIDPSSNNTSDKQIPENPLPPLDPILNKPAKKPPIKKPPIRKPLIKDPVIDEKSTPEVPSMMNKPMNFDPDEMPIGGGGGVKKLLNIDEMPINGKRNLDIDELPIGKSNKFEISEYPPDYIDPNNNTDQPQNIPLADRLKSKVWKIRQQAFEELTVVIDGMEPDLLISTYNISELSKYISDANPGAQEKALIAYKAYLNKVKRLEEELDEPVKILFEKVLVSAKANIKKLGTEILFDFFEKTTNFKGLSSNFLGLFNNKNPKTASIAIASFIEIFQLFGVKKFDYLKQWLCEIEKIASTSNVAAVKLECMNFYKEAYKFLGILKIFSSYLSIYRT